MPHRRPRSLAYSKQTQGPRSTICVVPESGGEGQDIINNPDLYATNPALSPDGAGIALSGFDVADLIYDGGKLPTGVGTIT